MKSSGWQVRMNTNNFNKILLLSRELETERMNRNLNEMVRDEYIVNEELSEKLETGTFEFPYIEQRKSDKRILTRKQQYFSAKIHVREGALYFHKHEFVELLYMYKGKCQQFMENLNTCITLNEGDLFFLNQNVVHGLLQKEEDAVLIKIIIPVEWMPYEIIQRLDHESILFDFFVGAKSPQRENYHSLHFTQCVKEEKRMIEKIMTEYYVKEKYYEEAIKNYLQLLMILLDREEKEYQSCKYRLPHSSLENGKIIQYVYEHSEDITLEELANVFSYNQSYLSRMIKENCKMNFRDLLRESRLEKAAELLICSNYSVDQIAQMVGYSNAAPIYQGIRRRFGLTPAEYRDDYRKIW